MTQSLIRYVMAACADIDSDDDSTINQPGEVNFDVNQETASEYQDKISSKSFLSLDPNYGVKRKAKCTYQSVFSSSPSSPSNTCQKNYAT